jgi:hypothetical protein
MSGRVLDSHLEIQPLPSMGRAVEELFVTLTMLVRTIEENPSIHHLFNDVELHAARRAISNYQRILSLHPSS